MHILYTRRLLEQANTSFYMFYLLQKTMFESRSQLIWIYSPFLNKADK